MSRIETLRSNLRDAIDREKYRAQRAEKIVAEVALAFTRVSKGGTRLQDFRHLSQAQSEAVQRALLELTVVYVKRSGA